MINILHNPVVKLFKIPDYAKGAVPLALVDVLPIEQPLDLPMDLVVMLDHQATVDVLVQSSHTARHFMEIHPLNPVCQIRLHPWFKFQVQLSLAQPICLIEVIVENILVLSHQGQHLRVLGVNGEISLLLLLLPLLLCCYLIAPLAQHDLRPRTREHAQCLLRSPPQ